MSKNEGKTAYFLQFTHIILTRMWFVNKKDKQYAQFKNVSFVQKREQIVEDENFGGYYAVS